MDCSDPRTVAMIGRRWMVLTRCAIESLVISSWTTSIGLSDSAIPIVFCQLYLLDIYLNILQIRLKLEKIDKEIQEYQ